MPELPNSIESNADETGIALNPFRVLIEDIQKFLPLIIIFCCFCGYFKLWVYYSAFDKTVLSFFEVSDILPELVVQLILLPIEMLFIFPILHKFGGPTITKIVKKEKSTPENGRTFIRFISRNRFFLYINLLFIIFFVLILFFKLNCYGFLLLWIGMDIVFATLELITNTFKLRDGKNRITLVILSIIVFSLFLCFLTGFSESRSVTNGYYKGTSFQSPTVKIVSNDTYFFIGKTSKYIFFYNKKEAKVDVFPFDKFLVLNIKTNKIQD